MYYFLQEGGPKNWPPAALGHQILSGGFLKLGLPQKVGWFRREHPKLKWMMTGGTPIWTHFRKPPWVGWVDPTVKAVDPDFIPGRSPVPWPSMVSWLLKWRILQLIHQFYRTWFPHCLATESFLFVTIQDRPLSILRRVPAYVLKPLTNKLHTYMVKAMPPISGFTTWFLVSTRGSHVNIETPNM